MLLRHKEVVSTALPLDASMTEEKIKEAIEKNSIGVLCYDLIRCSLKHEYRKVKFKI